MERHELWITDDADGRYRILVLLGLIAIGTALGYTIGLREGAAVNPGAVVSTPADGDVADAQYDVSDRAARDGDVPAIASYYGSAALAQRGRLSAWNVTSAPPAVQGANWPADARRGRRD